PLRGAPPRAPGSSGFRANARLADTRACSLLLRRALAHRRRLLQIGLGLGSLRLFERLQITLELNDRLLPALDLAVQALRGLALRLAHAVQVRLRLGEDHLFLRDHLIDGHAPGLRQALDPRCERLRELLLKLDDI